MITFIYSITNTSAAVTLLCLAAMPFFTALLGFLFLKEKISLNVWIAIFDCNSWNNNNSFRQYRKKFFIRAYIWNDFFNWVSQFFQLH